MNDNRNLKLEHYDLIPHESLRESGRALGGSAKINNLILERGNFSNIHSCNLVLVHNGVLCERFVNRLSGSALINIIIMLSLLMERNSRTVVLNR